MLTGGGMRLTSEQESIRTQHASDAMKGDKEEVMRAVAQKESA